MAYLNIGTDILGWHTFFLEEKNRAYASLKPMRV